MEAEASEKVRETQVQDSGVKTNRFQLFPRRSSVAVCTVAAEKKQHREGRRCRGDSCGKKNKVKENLDETE